MIHWAGGTNPHCRGFSLFSVWLVLTRSLLNHGCLESMSTNRWPVLMASVVSVPRKKKLYIAREKYIQVRNKNKIIFYCRLCIYLIYVEKIPPLKEVSYVLFLNMHWLLRPLRGIGYLLVTTHSKHPSWSRDLVQHVPKLCTRSTHA